MTLKPVFRSFLPACTLALVFSSLSVFAEDEPPKPNPFLPGGKWRVHDVNRPQPPIVKPGASDSQAPSDAVILFDGTDLSEWKSKDGPANWKIEDGELVIPPKTKKVGNITTKKEFGDMQLHLEFASPTPPEGEGQGRGNSGIFIMGRYELQILDNYKNKTYPDGQAAALYGVTPPLVNACRPPGEWQTYDIAFTAPRFDDSGKLVSPAYITVFQNGVLVQNHSPYLGPSTHKKILDYVAHGPKGPISLQNHKNPVRFRNIWVREVKPLAD